MKVRVGWEDDYLRWVIHCDSCTYRDEWCQWRLAIKWANRHARTHH